MTPYPGPTTRSKRSIRKKLVVLMTVGLLVAAAAPLASAQQYSLIDLFSASGTGAFPLWSPTIDRFGNLYVTVSDGGNPNCTQDLGCGIVFKGTLHNGNWVWNVLYGFTNGQDGAAPSGPVTLDASGAVYGAATGSNNGLVYELRPSATRPTTAIAPWRETVLFRFDGANGQTPVGTIVFDRAGNIYGTTLLNYGTVYKLTPTQGGYSETTLYSFQGGADGLNPYYGLTIDSAGNLYGVTQGDSTHCGTVWELSNNGSGWTKTTLYAFQGLNDSCYPVGPLARDSAGNLFGNAILPYDSSPSVVYVVSPANGSWTFSVLLSVAYPYTDGSLAVDTGNNVYGVLNGGGANGAGNIFELSPSGGGWTYTDVFDFTQNYVSNGVSRDSNGNFFSTTDLGGPPSQHCDSGCGTVWEVTH